MGKRARIYDINNIYISCKELQQTAVENTAVIKMMKDPEKSLHNLTHLTYSFQTPAS
jgi:hypothetical protein